MPSQKYTRLLKNLEHMKHIRKLKTNNSRKRYISVADDDLIACLVECSVNILKGNVKLTKKHKTSLKRHLKFLRSVGKERRVPAARTKLIQSGGLIPAIVAPILAALAATTVSELISKLI